MANISKELVRKPRSRQTLKMTKKKQAKIRKIFFFSKTTGPNLIKIGAIILHIYPHLR